MRIVVVLLIAVMISMDATAQSCTITGKVRGEGNSILEFANVVVFQDSIFVNGGTTNANGMFSIHIDKPFNQIKVSYLGYNDFQKELKDNSRMIDLGVISLRSSANMLQGVTVKAQYIQREADKIILRVSPLDQGKDAKGLLRTAPGVWVTDNAVSIYGKSGTRIYVNDMELKLSSEQLVSYLESLNASAISHIEIIANAGAEYNADSPGGIIKIVLKKTRNDGMIGSIGSSLTDGSHKFWMNPNLNLSYHNNKLTFNLIGSVNGSPSDRGTTYEKSTNETILSKIDGESAYKQKVLQTHLLIGTFYDIDPRHTIGLEVEYLPSRTNNRTTSTSIMTSQMQSLTTVGMYDMHEHNDNVNVRLNYTNQIDTLGSSWKLISNYSYQHASVKDDDGMAWIWEETGLEKDSTYYTDNLNRYNTLTTELKLDKHFLNRWNVISGVKYTYNNVLNNSEHQYLKSSEWISNQPYDYHSTYNENIVGIYALAIARHGRWSIKGGLRGEYFVTSSAGNTTTSFDLFPNANISYALTSKQDYSVSLGYYRNIRRPSFWSLSPIRRQISDYSFEVGNPDLKPSFSNSISLDFILANKITLATGYSAVNNVIRQKFTVDPEHPENMYLTYGNEGHDNSFFIHGDGRLSPTQWWNFFVSATYVLNSKKDDNETSYSSHSYVQLMGSTTFNLPSEFFIMIDAFYQSKIQIGNITLYPNFSITPTIKKIWNRKWTLAFSVENILQRDYKIRAESSGYDRLRSSKSYTAFKLTAVYNFNIGKGFRTKRAESNIDNSRLSKE